jgi:hypothetical protein
MNRRSFLRKTAVVPAVASLAMVPGLAVSTKTKLYVSAQGRGAAHALWPGIKAWYKKVYDNYEI